MIRYRLTAEDAAQVRFGSPSPVGESVFSIRSIGATYRHGRYHSWLTAVLPRLRTLDLRPLLAVVPPVGYIPDFLTPPPTSGAPDLLSELEIMRSTPLDRVVAEIGWLDGDELSPRAWREAHAPARRALLADPARAVDRLARLLAQVWDLALEPYWSDLRNLLKGQALRQSQMLAFAGSAAVVATLHSRVHWEAGQIAVESRYRYSVDLDGRGIILLPSAFSGARVLTMLPPEQPMLVYQSPHAGALWSTCDTPPEGSLATLLGRLRAAVLEAVTTPMSTTDLARQLSVTPGAVSQHLAVLRDCGLVVGERKGRTVLYQRTDLGDLLMIEVRDKTAVRRRVLG